ncbi:MAG: tetratricopeptide repeat protein, partial [Bacteroidota bacterium]
FEVNKAFKLLEKNQKLYPDFMPNKKDLGILHAIVGTIPDSYKWAVEWLSAAEGTIQQGQEELEEVLAYCEGKDFIFETETYVLYGYLMLHFRKNSERAWTVIQNSPLDPTNNPLAAFIQANIGMRIGKNDEAIQILQYRPKSRAFHPFPYLEFMHGTALLRRLDAQASVHFQRYLDQFTGQNFIKETYQKMAWSALIHGDQIGYQLHMQSCMRQGYLLTGSDESAQREAETGTIPNVDLLKGRLLFDGGYYQQAHQQLSLLGEQHFHSDTEKVEYWYRLGRVQQERQQHQQALTLFQKAIDRGQYLPDYYACRAALEAGHIYEHLGQNQKAKEYFNRCLDIKPEEHRSALHQAAKAGLNRLSS